MSAKAEGQTAHKVVDPHQRPPSKQRRLSLKSAQTPHSHLQADISARRTESVEQQPLTGGTGSRRPWTPMEEPATDVGLAAHGGPNAYEEASYPLRTNCPWRTSYLRRIRHLHMSQLPGNDQSPMEAQLPTEEPAAQEGSATHRKPDTNGRPAA